MSARTFSLGALCLILLCATPVFAQSGPLPSWNDGPSKSAITYFVACVATRTGALEFSVVSASALRSTHFQIPRERKKGRHAHL
jgi:hypothetical protein